jgi:Ca2+:H+ antiporter
MKMNWLLIFVPITVAPELAFGRAEIGSLLLAVLIGAMVSGDGRANWYKGVQLITVYAIMACLFYFMPEAAPQ